MYLYTYTCGSLKLLWNVRKSSTNLYRPPTKKAACTAWLEERRCDFTMKVNALKPRVLVSKVRMSVSDLECFHQSPRPQHQSSMQGASLPPRLCAKSQPHRLKHLSGKIMEPPSQIRFAPPSSEVNVFLQNIKAAMSLHFQCINHPPLFLGWSLAFGQHGEEHLARWTTKLTNILSTNPESGGPGEKQVSKLSSVGGTFLCLICYWAAGGRLLEGAFSA